MNGWKDLACHERACACGRVFREGDLIYRIGNALYCLECSDTAEPANPVFAMVMMDGMPRRVIEPGEASIISNGVYKLREHAGMNVAYEIISKDQVHEIPKATEGGFSVLEKRQQGIAVRFAKDLVTSVEEFSYADAKYDFIRELTDDYPDHENQFLCRDGQVIGVASMERLFLYRHDFVSFYGIEDVGPEGEIKKFTKKGAMALEVSRALHAASPADMLRFFEQRLIGQGDETKKIVFLFSEYLRQVAAGRPFVASNWVLTAPSGCGKTEVYRILRDYLRERKIPVPVLQIDLSNYTEAGFRGKEASEIVDQIAEASDLTDGPCICFLDEADKKCVPSCSSSGTDFNAAFQANLLTMVEGNLVKCGKDRKKREERILDTGKTMFVLMGAFQGIRNARQKETVLAKPIGFGRERNASTIANDIRERLHEELTIEDMIGAGMMEELAGRMEQVINLHRLSREDMVRLIRSKVREVADEMTVEIRITDEAMNEFLEEGNTNLGIRRIVNGLRTTVGEALSKVYFEEGFRREDCVVMIDGVGKAFAEEREAGREPDWQPAIAGR